MFDYAKRLKRSKELGLIVDPEDEWILTHFTWGIHYDDSIYAMCKHYPKHGKVRISLHLLVALEAGIEVKKNEYIKHRNGNIRDCRKMNLEIKTRGKLNE